MTQENPYADYGHITVVNEYEINGQKVYWVYADCANNVRDDMFVSDLDVKQLVGTRKFYANIKAAMKESGYKWAITGTRGCGFSVYRKGDKCTN